MKSIHDMIAELPEKLRHIPSDDARLLAEVELLKAAAEKRQLMHGELCGVFGNLSCNCGFDELQAALEAVGK